MLGMGISRDLQASIPLEHYPHLAGCFIEVIEGLEEGLSRLRSPGTLATSMRGCLSSRKPSKFCTSCNIPQSSRSLPHAAIHTMNSSLVQTGLYLQGYLVVYRAGINLFGALWPHTAS